MLAGNDPGDIRPVLIQELLEAEHDSGAALGRESRPCLEGAGGRAHGAIDLICASEGDLAHLDAERRIEHRSERARGVSPRSVDPVRHDRPGSAAAPAA